MGAGSATAATGRHLVLVVDVLDAVGPGAASPQASASGTAADVARVGPDAPAADVAHGPVVRIVAGHPGRATPGLRTGAAPFIRPGAGHGAGLTPRARLARVATITAGDAGAFRAVDGVGAAPATTTRDDHPREQRIWLFPDDGVGRPGASVRR